MKKSIFTIMTILCVFTMAFSSVALATSTGTSDAASVIGGLNNSASDGGILSGPVSKIIGVIKYIAIAVALGMVIIIGIKWMTAPAGGKAAVKDTFLPYLIGAICVGAASAIAQFAISLGGN